MTRRARTENDRGGRGPGAIRSLARRLRDTDPVALYLIIAGAHYVAIGASWVLIPSRARTAGVDWIPFLTPSVVGVIWVIAGAFMVGGALGAPTRVALIVAQTWPLALGSYFGVAYVLWLVTTGMGLPVVGSERGLSSLLIDWLIASGAYAVAELWADREEAIANAARPR